MKSRIVLAREYAKLNQKQLAEILGISASTLNGYEKGNHDPKSSGLIAIAKACNVTTDYLLGITDDIGKKNEEPTYPPQLNTIISKAQQLNSKGLEELEKHTDLLLLKEEYRKTEAKERAI